MQPKLSKVTNKRTQIKIISIFFMPSGSNFGEAKVLAGKRPFGSSCAN